MVSLVIFDLDGTLLNTIDDLGTAVNYALGVHNFPLHEIGEYPKMVGNGVRKLIERALPEDRRDEATIDAMLADFRTYYDAHLHDFTKPYEGIKPLLAELEGRNISLAVASNKYESAVKALIANLFPDTHFASVCGKTDDYPSKPDPSIVFRILSECPTPKSQVLYVGDSAIDMETAHRAAIKSVGVTWGFRPKSELTALADCIIDEPHEVIGLL